MLHSQNLGAIIKSLEGFFKTSSGDLFIPTMPKNNSLYLMGFTGIETAKILMRYDTQLMFSPEDEPFITTDNPFIFDRLIPDNHPPTVSSASFMKWIPLSAKVAVGFWLPGNKISFQEMNAAQVRAANFRLATAARQILIASSREQLEKVLAAMPKHLPLAATRFPSEVS